MFTDCMGFQLERPSRGSTLSHSAAWLALANRFEAVATLHDFDMWAYSVTHPPVGTELRTLRRVWNTNGLSFNTNHTALAIQGHLEVVQPDEYEQLNRFDWLAWAAGRLIRPNSEQPQRDWQIFLYNEFAERIERQENQGLLRDVVARSAEIARNLTCIHRPAERRFIAQPGGAWQLPFESLRQTFSDFSRGGPPFELELYASSNPSMAVFDPAWARRQEDDIQAGIHATLGGGSNHTLYSIDQCYKLFNDLATQAGRALPPALKASTSFFRSGSSQFPVEPYQDPFTDWCLFLWVTSPSSFKRCLVGRDENSRRTVWQGGNPFLASVLAIDQFVRGYSDETVPQFNRRIAEVCPWFSPDERPAIIEIIESAFEESSLQLVESTGEYVLQDIVAFLEWRQLIKRFDANRQMHLKPSMSALEALSYNQWCAFNQPIQGRLDEMGAASLHTYRRLEKAARTQFQTSLDLSIFLMLVADVCEATGTTTNDRMAMCLDEFGILMDRWEGRNDNEGGDPGDAIAIEHSSRRDRGRRPTTESDPKRVQKDIKLFQDWKSSGLTKKEFLHKRNIPEDDGLHAIDRGQYHARKSGNNSDG